MTETQNNLACLHRKEWQTMTPTLTATAAGVFVINDKANKFRFSLYIVSATVHYLYDHDNDDWIQIPSGAFGTALAVGACGCFADWSLTYTATGGSTTTITVNVATSNINGLVVGKYVEFLSGTAANLGLRRQITAISHPGGSTGTVTLTIDTAGGAVANNDTFRINSGMFYVLMPGTLTSTSFRKYDVATGAWTSCTNTGLPATWGTDANMAYLGMYGVSYDTVTDADIGTDTTIGLTTKSWTADQWINYQMRITGGTGIGQIRRITDNDATTLTVSSMNPDPDATSDFVIEGDENSILLLGNGAVTMYKYSISGNSWATVSPTTARGGAPIAGMTADFVGVTGDAGWADVTNIKNGRYIYSLRGGTAVLDRFDIAGGTAGAGAWSVITYQPTITTFTIGDSAEWNGKYIYIKKEASAAIPNRFYMFDVVYNTMIPFATDWYLGGAVSAGDLVWIHCLSSTGTIKWLYYLQHTSTTCRRIMIF